MDGGNLAFFDPVTLDQLDDYMVVLTALPDRDGVTAEMTKTFTRHADGKITARDYDKGFLFSMAVEPITDMGDLVRVVSGVDRHSCIVFGKPIAGANMACARRLKLPQNDGTLPTLEDAEHAWMGLDVDYKGDCVDHIGPFDPVAAPERAIEFLCAGRMPFELTGRSCFWQLSSSAGVFPTPGIHMRLWYKIDRKLSQAVVERWFKAYKKTKSTANNAIDLSLFNAEHVIYAAKPNFIGMADPVPVRSGFYTGGKGDVVAVPVFHDDPPREAAAAPERTTTVPDGFRVDSVRAIAAGLDVCRTWRVPTEADQNRNTTVAALAAKLKAIGCSETSAVELIEGEFLSRPGADTPDEGVAFICASIFKGVGKNPPGSELPPTMEEKYGPAVERWEADAAVAVAAEIEWKAAAPLFDFMMAEPKFDAATMLPPAIASLARQGAAHLGTGEVEIAMAALAVCATVLDNRVVIRVGNYTEPPVLWLIRVDDSGSNKTGVYKLVTGPIAQLRKWYLGETYEARQTYKKAKMQAPASMTLSGQPIPTPTRPDAAYIRDYMLDATLGTTAGLRRAYADNPANIAGCGIYADEIAGLFHLDSHADNNSSREFLLNLFDDHEKHISMAGSTIIMKASGTSIYGNMTTFRLAQQINAKNIEDGFLSRFLVMRGDGVDREEDWGATVNDRDYRELLFNLDKLAPVEVVVSPAQQDRFLRPFHNFSKIIREDAGTLAMRRAAPKMIRLIERLALVFHAILCAECPYRTVKDEITGEETTTTEKNITRAISDDALRMAFRLMYDYFLPMMERLYADLSTGTNDQTTEGWARRIADWLLGTERREFSTKALTDGIKQLRSADYLRNETLAWLTEHGWLRPIGWNKPADGGGPTRWEVNPEVFIKYAERVEAEKIRRASRVRRLQRHDAWRTAAAEVR